MWRKWQNWGTFKTMILFSNNKIIKRYWHCLTFFCCYNKIFGKSHFWEERYFLYLFNFCKFALGHSRRYHGRENYKTKPSSNWTWHSQSGNKDRWRPVAAHSHFPIYHPMPMIIFMHIHYGFSHINKHNQDNTSHQIQRPISQVVPKPIKLKIYRKCHKYRSELYQFY